MRSAITASTTRGTRIGDVDSWVLVGSKARRLAASPVKTTKKSRKVYRADRNEISTATAMKTGFSEANTPAMIPSLDQKPAKSGMPAAEQHPISIVHEVTRIL